MRPSAEGELAPDAVFRLGKLVDGVSVLLVLPDLCEAFLQPAPDLGESGVGKLLLECDTVPVGDDDPLGVVGEWGEESTRDLPWRSDEDGSHGASLATVSTSDEDGVGHEDKATLVVRNGVVDEGANFNAVGALLVFHRWKGLLRGNVDVIEDRDGDRSVGDELGESAVGSAQLADGHAVFPVGAEARQVHQRHCCNAQMSSRSGSGVFG